MASLFWTNSRYDFHYRRYAIFITVYHITAIVVLLSFLLSCRFAIVLFTRVSLQGDLIKVGSDASKVSITNFYPAIKLPQDPGRVQVQCEMLISCVCLLFLSSFVIIFVNVIVVITVAVGATLGIFIILFIILIGFIIYWKRFVPFMKSCQVTYVYTARLSILCIYDVGYPKKNPPTSRFIP